METRQHILLLFGGESSEHEVSIASARNVYEAIDKNKCTVTLGYIDRQGRWWAADSIASSLPPESMSLIPKLGQSGFEIGTTGQLVSPDVILPILHGKNGEDGSVQALGQLLHIPVVGCDMTASAICMDKVATKDILSANGILIVPYRTHRLGEADIDVQALIQELGLPFFVKPARAGSSVGVSKVTAAEMFSEAMRLAHEHDDVVLVEQAMQGRELEVAVLGNPPHHKASAVGEIVAGDEFYSYDAKYSPESTSQAVIPAELSPEAASDIRATARQAYAALGCRGMARVDFFLTESGEIYVNEVNTIPGFTDISMYPKLWQHEGMSYQELIDRLIMLSLGDTIQSA